MGPRERERERERVGRSREPERRGEAQIQLREHHHGTRQADCHKSWTAVGVQVCTGAVRERHINHVVYAREGEVRLADRR